MATVKLRDYLLALSSKGTAAGDSDKITILDSADGNAIKTILKSDLVDLDSLVSELQDDFLDQFGEGTFSGSAQVDHDTTTNFVANEHIDHTTVSIIAGTGLTGGGDISSDRTINIVSDNNGIVVNADQIELDTDSSTFSGGVLTKMNIEQVVSGSSQISADQTDGWVGDVKTQLNSNTVISGSSQVVLNDADKTGFDTADVVEGTNLYYTDARVLSKINTEGVLSGSTFSSPSQGTLTTTINGVSSNVDLGLQSGDNVTFVDGTFTGNLSINGNLDVLGAAVEIQTSELRIEDKLITVASGSADSAASDGGGLEIDGANKSLKWNHSTQQFVFDAKVSSSVGFKGEGGELTGIDTDQVTEAGNLYYTDTRVKTKLNTEGVVSGSSQIDVTQTTNYSSINQYTDSDNTSHLNSLGVVSGSSQIDVTATTNYSSINQYTDSDNLSYINSLGVQSGSDTPHYTDSDNTSHLNSLGVVSGSSQIDVTQTTNYGSINQYTDSDNLSYLNSLLVVSKSAGGDLDVNGDITGSSAQFTGTVSASLGQFKDILISDTSPFLDFVDRNSFSDPSDRFRIRANIDTGIIQWYDGGTSTATNIMTFNQDLSVSTNSDLEVGGNIDVTGDITGSGLNIIDTSNPGSDYGSVVIEGRRDGSPNVLTLRAKDNGTPASALPQDQGAVVRWQGFDGTDFANMGYILVAADGQTVAASDAPSYMAFGVSPDGSETPSEVMRLDSDGVLSLNDTSNDVFLNNNGTAMEIDVNRHPETGVFSDTAKGHARISLIGDTGGSKIQFKTANAINTTATSVAEISSGSFSVLDNKIEVGNTSVSANGVTIEKTGNHLFLRATTATAGEYWNFDVDTNNRLSVINDNSVGVYIDDAATSWTGTSDERLKTINHELTGSLVSLQDIRAVNYSWVSGSSDKNFIGLIAQDVEQHYPEMISEDRDGYKGIRYTEMIPVLVSAIKEQQSIIDDLKSRIETLENQ